MNKEMVEKMKKWLEEQIGLARMAGAREWDAHYWRGVEAGLATAQNRLGTMLDQADDTADDTSVGSFWGSSVGGR